MHKSKLKKFVETPTKQLSQTTQSKILGGVPNTTSCTAKCGNYTVTCRGESCTGTDGVGCASTYKGMSYANNCHQQ